MPTPFEQNNNTTATYHEAIAFYQNLAASYSQLELKTYGATDSGHPLHLAILSKDEDFDPESIRRKGKNVLLINNAIHPGEPCGVDATMLFLRDLLTQKERQTLLEKTVIIAIPVYNIGGALNRNSTTRANQNGPASYGFRGNARNLDLNRDFIKCDSRNAQTFNQLFNEWNPTIFVDNHTSNGADYQYTMTLIATQHSKLSPPLATYLQESLLPRLYREMDNR
ncbi:MAG: M14 family zinc carboxypeptidase, partial [Bacteroidota bacterium]